MSIIQINNLSYVIEPNMTLFKDFSIGLGKEKTGLVGRNGTGKTTLLQIITGNLAPTSGSVTTSGIIAYLPQNPPINTHTTVAALLGIEEKLKALTQYFQGSDDPSLLKIINNSWDIQEKANATLHALGLEHLDLLRSTENLSGGEITQILLTKSFLANPDFLILDEPTNNLDTSARSKLFTYLKNWNHSLLLVSHDRHLLSLMDQILEITPKTIKLYGVNYSQYEIIKAQELLAAEHEFDSAKRELKKTERSIKDAKRLKQQRDKAGHKKALSTGVPKMLRGAMKDSASKTDSRQQISDERRLQEAQERKDQSWEQIELIQSLNIDLSNTTVPNGKIILSIKDLSFRYSDNTPLIVNNFNLTIAGPERIALSGKNGSGKTTLLKLITKILTPISGTLKLGTPFIAYIDQHQQSLNPILSILDNFKKINPSMPETEARHALAKFLFPNTQAYKIVQNLSGGEKLRATLACLLSSSTPPQLLILDEPTNHIDLDSLKQIENALNLYQGAILVISHDPTFLSNINIEKTICLSNPYHS